MEPSFEKLLAALADGEVRFILVGGLAVALNGYVRLTEDVDILLDTEEENVRRKEQGTTFSAPRARLRGA